MKAYIESGWRMSTLSLHQCTFKHLPCHLILVPSRVEDHSSNSYVSRQLLLIQVRRFFTVSGTSKKSIAEKWTAILIAFPSLLSTVSSSLIAQPSLHAQHFPKLSLSTPVSQNSMPLAQTEELHSRHSVTCVLVSVSDFWTTQKILEVTSHTFS